MAVDLDIGITLLYRIWSVLAGGVLLFVIPIYLTPDEQGYYFTISSLIALQVFFELGFNFVVTQTVSHEMAKVKITDGYKLNGDVKSIFKICSLIWALPRWYTYISTSFFLVVFSLGFVFFWGTNALDINQWLPVWGLVTFFTAVNLFCSPYLSVMEGFGYVAKVARVRLIQSIIGYSFFVIALMYKSGLYALPCISGTAAFISVIQVIAWFKKISHSSISNEIIADADFEKERISWWRDIRPLQVKLAISWFSGYLIFQLFNPLLFKHQGARVSGQVGLALTIYSTILSISMSWINAKVPIMSRLISEKNFYSVNRLFKSLASKSLLVNLFCIISFGMLIVVLNYYGFSIINRLPSFEILIMISLATIINHLIFCMALYMRSFKEEPLVICSLISGLVTAVLVYIGSIYSAEITILCYLIVTATISLPWVVFIFVNYRHGVALK